MSEIEEAHIEGKENKGIHQIPRYNKERKGEKLLESRI